MYFYICELTFCVVPYRTFLLLYVWNIQHYYQFKIILQGWGTKQAPLGKCLAVQSDKLSLTSKTPRLQDSPFLLQTKWRRKKINITSKMLNIAAALGHRSAILVTQAVKTKSCVPEELNEILS